MAQPPSDPPLQAGPEALPLRPMGHSIAARYAARPTASFVRPSVRARQRRLGLRALGSFDPAPNRATVLRIADIGPLVAMRAASRTIRPARPRPIAGPPR